MKDICCWMEEVRVWTDWADVGSMNSVSSVVEVWVLVWLGLALLPMPLLP